MLKRFILPSLMLVCLPALIGGAENNNTPPWIPDRGDGTYQNPVLFADYSDPDAVRVGDDFYLVSSSFLAAPGLPILHSKDLVNWTIINHVFAAQPPAEHFSKPRHGQGVWAPAFRYHDHKFWITYPDPDFGIYLTTAKDPAGEWTPPLLIKPGRGLIDPCPFWDDDGQLYLIHGWAKSRAGISNLLTLHKLNADGTALLDAGEIIIDGNKIPNWNTLEGPKLYKRNGYYYVFAPSGGVATGYQAVFRSKNIRGPYEYRNVLDQGKTAINGPHQGAWVDTPSGEDWFLHFQDLGVYGRVVHLQPMSWKGDWPVIGADPDGDGKGEPMPSHRKPAVGPTDVTAPQTSDEFDDRQPGLQWQWNANPRPEWASLTARPGFLRLTSIPAPATRNDLSPAPHSIYDAPNFLLQKFPAPEFTVTTKMEFAPMAEGETAGLTIFGYDYALLGLRKTAAGTRVVLIVNHESNQPGAEEHESAAADAGGNPVYLRVTVTRSGNDAWCHFAYGYDNRSFIPVGEPFKASGDRWIGAKVGLIATADSAAIRTGHADFDWFQVTSGVTEPHDSLARIEPPIVTPGTGISGPGAVHTSAWQQMNAGVTGSAVKAGLLPDLKPLIPDTQLRDTVVILGGDGNYYLTGSSGADIWDHNDGVELWRSPDLKTWNYVGLVWTFDHDATWPRDWRWHHKAVRALWAPELHYLKRLNNYFITFSMPPGDRGILKSTSGKPEGPYVNALANDGRLPADIDASLFEDDDGAVYLVYGGGWVARMKDDLSGLAEEPRKPELLHPDLDPKHHAETCPPKRNCADIGREGAFLFKRNGKYYLTAADTYEGRYSSMVAMSDKIYGPYDQRHEAVPTGGGTDYFQDKEGDWWCGYFGNDDQAPFREQPAIVKVEFSADGHLRIADEQPAFVLRKGAATRWRKAPGPGPVSFVK